MDIEAQIKFESSTAAKLSKEANREFAAKNFATGKALMRQAYEAGQRCQSLIQQYNQSNTNKC